MAQHLLKINSLHDASAECSCGGWSFVRTGSATRGELDASHALHRQVNAAMYPRMAVGICREDNPADVDETYGNGTYARLFPKEQLSVRQLGTNWLVEDQELNACLGVFPTEQDAKQSAKAIETYLKLINT